MPSGASTRTNAQTLSSNGDPGPSWHGPPDDALFRPEQVAAAARRFRETTHVLVDPTGRRLGVGIGGEVGHSADRAPRVLGTLPPLYPEWLGDRSFCLAHGVRFPYVAGEMANGIAATGMVVAMARAGMLGFFGAAGLSPIAVDRAVGELHAALGDRANWGVNLIHSPNQPDVEHRVADVVLRRGVRRVSASAFTAPTAAVVRCAAAGLRRGPDGGVVRRTHLFAKVSHLGVAESFLSPAPPALLRELVDRGDLTAQEAELAAGVPLATDLTVEADSGGHTDNRPLVALLPAVLALRDGLARRHRSAEPVRVGAAGGLGTPAAVAAAFGLGAAYVLTGSVNQSCVESGLSADAKAMLAEADLADVAMAPAADLFEFGGKVQVLRRGTMYAQRAARLYEAYRRYPGLDAIPASTREELERDVLHASLAEVWALTREYWQRTDPREVATAEADQKHRMALVFRWYLGMASRWAVEGRADRRTDYQIWCGPAMGAFNRWVAGSPLAAPAGRSVVQVALNLLEGAAVVSRAQQLRAHGVPVPASAFLFTPRRLA